MWYFCGRVYRKKWRIFENHLIAMMIQRNISFTNNEPCDCVQLCSYAWWKCDPLCGNSFIAFHMERFVCHFLPGWIFHLIFFVVFKENFNEVLLLWLGALPSYSWNFARIIARSWHNGNKFGAFPWHNDFGFSHCCVSLLITSWNSHRRDHYSISFT